MCAMAGDTHAKTTTIVAAVKEASHGVTRSGYAYAVDMLLQLASVAAFDAICLSSAATGAAWMSALLSAARGGCGTLAQEVCVLALARSGARVLT